MADEPMIAEDAAPDAGDQPVEPADLTLDERLLLHAVEDDGQPAFELPDGRTFRDIDAGETTAFDLELEAAVDAAFDADEATDEPPREEAAPAASAREQQLLGQVQAERAERERLTQATMGMYRQLQEIQQQLQGPVRLAQQVEKQASEETAPEPGTPEWVEWKLDQATQKQQETIKGFLDELRQGQQQTVREQIVSSVRQAANEHPDYQDAVNRLGTYFQEIGRPFGKTSEADVLNAIDSTFAQWRAAGYTGTIGQFLYEAGNYYSGRQPATAHAAVPTSAAAPVPAQQTQDPDLAAAQERRGQAAAMMPPDGGRPPAATPEMTAKQLNEMPHEEFQELMAHYGGGDADKGFERWLIENGGVVNEPW